MSGIIRGMAKQVKKPTKRTATAKKTTKSAVARTKKSTKVDYYPNRIPLLTTTLGVVTIVSITMIIVNSYL